MKKIKLILKIIALSVMLWAVVSYFNVLGANTMGGGEIAAWNLFSAIL